MRTTTERPTRLSIEVKPELRRKLERLAEEHDQTISECIEHILAQAVDSGAGTTPSALPHSLGAGEDAELAAKDSKAWLREHWGR